MSTHRELSRFTGSGKTFFFNVGKARNDTEYLAINALYGKGNQERIVLFPPHLLEFRKHLERAVTELTGAHFAPEPEGEEEIPGQCPKCFSWYGVFRVYVDPATRQGSLQCDNCKEIVWQL